MTMATDQSLPKKIAVLMGGPGSERDVSLATGRGVSKALRSLGAEVVDVDVHDEHFALPKDVDLAFITIHGTFGEDGQLQKILEERSVPYTGDGVEPSRAAFDKISSKEVARSCNIPVIDDNTKKLTDTAVASVEAKRRSQYIVRIKPRPTAAPLTAAITGFGIEGK